MSEADIKAMRAAALTNCAKHPNSCECPTFIEGATWGLERANARIEELESKLKLADRNNELLRGHRDQLEAKIKPDDDIIPEDYYIK